MLHIVGGNDRGKQYQLRLPQMHIGRGADQDIVLADIAVSRRHVQIGVEGDRYRITDLGSGNGTLVNGVRVETALLTDGDQIEIGSTVMRIEHGPSRPVQPGQPAQMAQPVPQAAPDNKTLIGDVEGFPLPSPVATPPYAPAPVPTPVSTHSPVTPASGHDLRAAAPLPPPPSHAGMAAGQPRMKTPPMGMATAGGARRGGLLDTRGKKIALFASLGVVVVLAGTFALKALVGGGGKAERQFATGQKAFAEGDYATARQLFGEALAADPGLEQAAKYIKQCDIELQARGKLKQAQGLAAGERWVEALRELDSIDKTALAYRESSELRRQVVPKAVEQLLADARDLMKDEPEEAQGRVDQALALEPENAEAAQLDRQLKTGKAPAAAVVAEAPSSPPPRSEKPSKPAAVARPEPKRAPSRPAASAPSEPAAAGGASIDLLSSPAAGPYRSKDFEGAARALRSVQGAQQRAAAALAKDLSQLQAAFAKAEADKTPGAIPAYQQAMAIDARVANGLHAAYFRGQLGKLSKLQAQQALQQGKLDVAFESAKNAVKYGSDDGGVQAQLKVRATQLLGLAEAQKRSNLNEAKTLWRLVIRIVPPGDPSFVRASQALAATQSKPTDEDE